MSKSRKRELILALAGRMGLELHEGEGTIDLLERCIERLPSRGASPRARGGSGGSEDSEPRSPRKGGRKGGRRRAAEAEEAEAEA